MCGRDRSGVKSPFVHPKYYYISVVTTEINYMRVLLTILFIAFVAADSMAAISKKVAGDSIPELNEGIVAFVEKNMGKKVDRGECWDLAAFALRSVDAKWDGKLKYGKEVFPAKEEIYPGDIIQFEKVVIEYKEGNRLFRETMGPHTAIVYKVNGRGDYQIAHQNYGPWGRKVGVSNLKLANIKKGEIWIYRPVKN